MAEESHELDPQASAEDLPEESPKPRFLFGDPEEAAFEDPKQGVLALVDWGRGWRNTIRTHTRRAFRLSPSTTLPASPHAGARTAVLLPGVWERWEALGSWAKALQALGWNIHFVPELDLQLGTLEELATTLGDHLQARNLEDVLIVAHSKGGLVTKKLMTGTQGWRVAKLISCGTPYDGAPIANLSAPALQMRSLVPWDKEIVELSAQHEPNSRIIAIQARWDQNVPPDPDLPGAKILTVPVTGHNALLTAPEVIAVISHFAGAQWDEPTSGATVRAEV